LERGHQCGRKQKRTLSILESTQDSIADYNAFVGQQQFLLNNNSDTKSSETTLYIKTLTPEKLASLKESIRYFLQQNYPFAIADFEKVDNIFNVIFSESKAPLIAHLKQLENSENFEVSDLKAIRNTIQKELPNVTIAPLSTEENKLLVANKEKMTLYEVPTDMLTTTLESAFNEKQITSLLQNQEYVPIVLGQQPKTIRETLTQTQVQANDSTYFALSDFVSEVTIENLKTITSGKDGVYYPLYIETSNEETVMQVISNVVASYPKFSLLFSGSIFKNRALINELLFSLMITLILLYFILASQFESLVLPLIILIEIPASISGALIALYLFGFSLNLMSMIGIIVMSGIVINDSILKIDTTIQLQKSGMNLMKALYVAGQRRLRPILMTSLTTILALVPILFSGGIGAELQAPLVVSLIGGMILGTLVSLYLIPLCYYNLLKKKSHAVS
jgi:multidrug efflux pump subunit AcrB